MTLSATVDSDSTGASRHNRYTPAVTMVAAWMSADTGVGPAMASGSHTDNGSCADLPAAPRKKSRAIAVAVDGGERLGLGVDHEVVHRAERGEREEDADHEPEVADAVRDERLLAGDRGFLAGEPERDQEVGARSHALPTEERDHEVVAEDEHQHREDEQVHVDEELRELLVAVHVPDRVHVDQRRDAGDEQRPSPSTADRRGSRRRRGGFRRGSTRTGPA